MAENSWSLISRLGTGLFSRVSACQLVKTPRSCYSSSGGPRQVYGWVSSARHHKNVSFINVTDGRGPATLQIVALKEIRGDITDLKYGAAVQADGEFVSRPDKEQVEFRANRLQVVGSNDVDSYPFAANTRTYTADYNRQHLHLRSKLPEFGALLRLRSYCHKLVHDFFHSNDFVHINTPILTANDCEGAGELFTVSSTNKDNSYFGDKSVFLTVSGQLHLEASNLGISDVYTFGPTFRADNAVDRMHLAEFYMLEAEVAFRMGSITHLMDFIEKFLKTILSEVNENMQEDIGLLHSGCIRCEKVDLSSLEKAEFVRLTYGEAITLLSKSSEEFTVRPRWGDDLRREHEHALLAEYGGSTPVFVTDWPKSLKPFYMYANDDQQTVACLDLIVPGPGELFGGSVRESRFDRLSTELRDRNMLESYQWYLDLRKYGGVPHAGFGMGFERLLQFMLGVKNIRDTIPFPRYAGNCRL